MQAFLSDFAAWLNTAGIGQWARGGVYPAINVAHVLGLIALVGGIGVVDLRLTGLWRGLPAAVLARALTPIAVVGLLVMLASGVLLFAADGPALARSGLFQFKIALVGLAVGNALIFRWRWRDASNWDERPSSLARLSATFSLALWLTIVVAGRMIAYS